MVENLTAMQKHKIKNGGDIAIIQDTFKGEISKYLFPTKLSKVKFEIKQLHLIYKEMRFEKEDVKDDIFKIIDERKILSDVIKTKRKQVTKIVNVRHNVMERILELRKEQNTIKEEDEKKIIKLNSI